MSLFDATVNQVVKDASDKTLVPVPCRILADYCKITWLVQRKTRSWHLPWKSPYKYIPTEFTLNDILTEPIDVKEHQKLSVLFQNYTSTPSFHKAGKIGGKIAEEFDVDVSVNEMMQVSLKLGDVKKREVLWQQLYETVNGKMVKTDHPLLKTIKNSQKKSLCLIGMVVTCSFTETIDGDRTFGADLGGKPCVALNLSSSGSSETKKHREYAIPPDTTLAYSCYRLKVENNGALNLQLGDDLTDAPPRDEEKFFQVECVQEVLNGLLTNEVGNDLIVMLRNILKNEPTCGFKLNVVVENGIEILQGEDVLCTITPQHLEKMFTDICKADCFKFLETAGFQIDNNNNKLVCQGKLDLMISLNALLDCLSEMNNTQIRILMACDISHKNDIMLAMQKAIEKTDGSIEFSKVYDDDCPVMRFLKSVGLDLARSDSSFCVEYLPTCQPVLQLRSSMVAVCGMCSV